MEDDARERTERKRERERVGKERKRKANGLFRRGEFSTAVESYSEAIEQMPWDVSLYTNRALVSARVIAIVLTVHSSLFPPDIPSNREV